MTRTASVAVARDISTLLPLYRRQNLWQSTDCGNSISDGQAIQEDPEIIQTEQAVDQGADVVRPAFSMLDVKLLVVAGGLSILAGGTSLFWAIGTADAWAVSVGGVVFGSALISMARLRVLGRRPIAR